LKVKATTNGHRKITYISQTVSKMVIGNAKRIQEGLVLKISCSSGKSKKGVLLK
jgi:hypothetical protein